MSTKNTDTRTGDIKKFEVYSNKGGTAVDLSGGIVDLRYYESVLSNTVSMTAVVMDTGFKADGDGNAALTDKGVLDGLPIRGGEQTVVKIVDSKDDANELSFSGETSFYVNRVRAGNPNVNQDMFILDFSSRELFANEQSRVVQRYDGKISENVKKILEDNDGLKVEKEITVDETLIDYNFIGNDRKPFYICTWLASKSVPAGKGEKGAAAGYFFYETYDGFNFRSIDALFDQEYKKKYLYNDNNETKDGFEKVVSYNIDRDVDLHQNLVLGTYANRSLFFDFYAMDYKVREYSYDDNQKDKLIVAGSDGIDSVADEFRTPVSRLMNHVLDVGTLPPGKDISSQLSNWKNSPFDPTYDATNTMVQSIMRYNQMFTIKINIVIAGDFTLRAGDLIYCEFPQVTGDPNKEKNEQSGGIYMISSLCHRITSEDTFTSLTLVRDSFGRKPF